MAGNLNQYHFKYFAPYVSDEWKVNSRLTLNLGVRWDYRNVPYETHDKLFWIDPNNAQGGLCFADKTLLTNGIARRAMAFTNTAAGTSRGRVEDALCTSHRLCLPSVRRR